MSSTAADYLALHPPQTQSFLPESSTNDDEYLSHLRMLRARAMERQTDLERKYGFGKYAEEATHFTPYTAEELGQKTFWNRFGQTMRQEEEDVVDEPDEVVVEEHYKDEFTRTFQETLNRIKRKQSTPVKWIEPSASLTRPFTPTTAFKRVQADLAIKKAKEESELKHKFKANAVPESSKMTLANAKTEKIASGTRGEGSAKSNSRHTSPINLKQQAPFISQSPHMLKKPKAVKAASPSSPASDVLADPTVVREITNTTTEEEPILLLPIPQMDFSPNEITIETAIQAD